MILSTLFAIAFLIRTFLIHGFVPIFLLICSLVPLIKDKLGNLSSSENYRAIAISSLFLKILDWVMILLHGDKLQASDLQFGFSVDNSTTMCTWIATEVIGYYIRNNKSVYSCLLNLKKAFDQVEFGTLFYKMKQRKFPKIFLRILIFIYIEQSCRVKWNDKFSATFTVRNGVRQGAVLSPTLFSLYIDSLLIKLERSGYGCHINNYFYGYSAYADDIILLSPTRNGLQNMFNICVEYFKEHKITISTNVDIKKSKTKCIYFSHTKSNVEPACILFNNKPLPWVDTWPHLGNELVSQDLSVKAGSNLKTDLEIKRRKFIGKFHALKQEFGFSTPEVLLNLVKIYATSFYGSVLWNLSGTSANTLFTSWNSLIRIIWKLPNTSHRYFLEEISESSHLKSILSQRYLGFMHSLIGSKKKCLSELAKKLMFDQGSISGQNIDYIAKSAGYDRFSVMNESPRSVASAIKYAPVSHNSIWKVSFLKELLNVRDGDLCVGNEEEGFSKEEIQQLINLVSTD